MEKAYKTCYKTCAYPTEELNRLMENLGKLTQYAEETRREAERAAGIADHLQQKFTRLLKRA